MPHQSTTISKWISCEQFPPKWQDDKLGTSTGERGEGMAIKFNLWVQYFTTGVLQQANPPNAFCATHAHSHLHSGHVPFLGRTSLHSTKPREHHKPRGSHCPSPQVERLTSDKDSKTQAKHWATCKWNKAGYILGKRLELANQCI